MLWAMRNSLVHGGEDNPYIRYIACKLQQSSIGRSTMVYQNLSISHCREHYGALLRFAGDDIYEKGREGGRACLAATLQSQQEIEAGSKVRLLSFFNIK